MRVEVLNLAAANFNFQSILSSKSFFAGKSNGTFLGKSEQKKKRSQLITHRLNLEKLSAVAFGER
jgi:hypothetical protein